LLLHLLPEYGFMQRRGTLRPTIGSRMRCNGTMNELAGTRIAVFAPSRVRMAASAMLPVLLLLTSP
jgi:hypothetical protein